MGYISELESDFFESSYFQTGMNYNKNFEDIDAMLNDGNYFDNTQNVYIRPVSVVYKEQSGEVAFLVRVESTGEGDEVNARVVGVYSPIMVSDALYSISYGLGAKWDRTSNDFIQMVNDATHEFGEEVYSVIDGTRKIKDTIVEWVNEYILNKYGDVPIEMPYIATQKKYPEGQSTLVEWDNSKIADVSSAISYENDYIGAVPFDSLHEQLTQWAETNQDVRDILSCSNVRTYLIGNNTYQHYSICGWTIDNNTIVTTQHEGYQTYAVTITSMKWMRFTTSTSEIYQQPPQYPTFTQFGGTGTWTGRQSIVINNKKKNDDWLNAAGLPFQMSGIGGLIDVMEYWDSMGFVGSVKPYEVLPLSGLWTRNPDNTYDVGEPDEDDETPEEDKQIIVRYGIIPPKIIIITHKIKGKTKVITRDEETTPMDTKVPTPDDGALYHMHQIDEDNLKTFSSKLWDRTFIEQLKEIWTNNPLDGVISLHQVYYSPKLKRGSGGEPEVDKLVLGYLKMNDVDVWNIANRYQELNFGSIPITKIFEDRRDYEREVIIYLPFIGFNQLDMSDLVGATKQTAIQLKYIVDNLTGDCVATLYINKDGNKDNKILYMFSGNCASQLPLTSADRTQLITSTIGTIGGVISSAVGGFARGGAMGAVGGAMGGVFGGALQALGNAQANITKSGNVSGNMGAMSYKYAFVVINSPISQDAENFAKYGGYSTNVTTTLSYCKGFTRMTECIIDNVPCTSYEMDTIKSMLASGVIV